MTNLMPLFSLASALSTYIEYSLSAFACSLLKI